MAGTPLPGTLKVVVKVTVWTMVKVTNVIGAGVGAEVGPVVHFPIHPLPLEEVAAHVPVPVEQLDTVVPVAIKFADCIVLSVGAIDALALTGVLFLATHPNWPWILLVPDEALPVVKLVTSA